MDYVERAKAIMDGHASDASHPAIAEHVEEICAVLVGVEFARLTLGDSLKALNLQRVLGNALFMIGYRAGQAAINEVPDAFKRQGESDE